MAIDPGPWTGPSSNPFRIGIDVSRSPSTVTHSTTSVKYTIKYYVQSRYPVADNESLSYYGPGTSGSPANFYHNQSGGSWRLVTTQTYTRTIYFNSRTQLTWSARLGGVYNGANPYHSVSVTTPYRPADEPDAPPTPSTSLPSPTSIAVSWSTPDSNGSSLTRYQVQIYRGSTQVGSAFSGDRAHTFSGLDTDTEYRIRVRAENGVGWGPWSNWRYRRTGVVAPDAPTGLSTTNIGPTSARFVWGYPPDDGGSSVYGYRLQVSTNSSFTNLVYNVYVESTARNRTVDDLLPGQTYWARVRASSEGGNGPYSSSHMFETLSGVKVGDGSAWRDAVVWKGDGSNWVLCEVKVGNGTNWVP